MQAHRIRRDPPGQRPAAVRPLSRASRPARRDAADDDFDFEPIAAVAPAPPVRARARAVAEVDDRPSDRRRVFSALLSSVVPGTGQLVNARWRIAVQFALPSLVLDWPGPLDAHDLERHTELLAQRLAVARVALGALSQPVVDVQRTHVVCAQQRDGDVEQAGRVLPSGDHREQ